MIRVTMAFLFVCCLTLATVLNPSFQRLHNENSSTSVFVALLGDSRTLFAHEFFAKADAYFHSGFYPTIFDTQKPGSESDLKDESHDKQAGSEAHEEESSFLGAPKDWMERFGRHFYPTVHTHLHGGNEREMLPWLKLSAELDPHEIATYLTASYWLRTTLNKPEEAEVFLREGLRANPDSYAILLELGRVYFNNRKNPRVARNIFIMAREKWRRQDAAGDKPDPHSYEEILGEIVQADRALGDVKGQLADLEELIKVAHSKEPLQREIDELKSKQGQAKP
jgi:hypothetical protein